MKPKKRARRGKKKAAARRNPRRAARRNPRRRMTAAVPAVTRRRVRGKNVRRPATVKIVLSDIRSRKRRSTKRRSYRKPSSRKTKHRKGKRRSSRRSSSTAMIPMSSLMENPLGGYALENPLSGGEMALAFVTAGLGFLAGDMLDRYLATRAGVAATGGPGTGGTLDNASAILAPPGIWRVLAQGVAAGLPIVAAGFVHQPMGRAALQGMGLGIGAGLVKTLIEDYLLVKILGTSNGTTTAFGARYFPSEVAAAASAAALPPSTTTTTTTTTGTAGFRGLGRSLPYGIRPNVRGLGDCNDCTPVTTGTPPALPTPYPVQQNPSVQMYGSECLPCSNETSAAALASAYQAAREEVGCSLCGGSGGGGGCGGCGGSGRVTNAPSPTPAPGTNGVPRSNGLGAAPSNGMGFFKAFPD